MRGTVIAVVAALTVCASVEAQAAPLDKGTQDRLEGRWATHCGARISQAPFDPSMEIEFQRSGGSLFDSDGADIEQRGRILNTARAGNDITLTISFSENAGPETRHLRLSGANRMTSRASRGKAVAFRRCEKPDRVSTAGLSAKAATDLTLSSRGSIFFAEGSGPGVNCNKVKSFLRLDLLGPVTFNVHRWGDAGDEWLKVREATEKDGAILISGTASVTDGKNWQASREEERRLEIRWFDDSRIDVQPWGVPFTRCLD